MCSAAASSHPSVIAPDEEDFGSTRNVDVPWETNPSFVVYDLTGNVTGKFTLRDSEGFTTWDNAKIPDCSAKQCIS
jgi:hypothetical protein